MQKRYREEFETPLAQVMTELETLPGDMTSPTLATFREIAAMPSFTLAPRRTLFIVSDLLEHSHEQDHYRQPSGKSALSPFPSPVGFHDALPGVESLCSCGPVRRRPSIRQRRTSSSGKPSCAQQEWPAITSRLYNRGEGNRGMELRLELEVYNRG